MILQALTEYYQALEREGKIAAPGWSPVKVSYALCLAMNGTLERVDFMQTEKDSPCTPEYFPPCSGQTNRGRGG